MDTMFSLIFALIGALENTAKAGLQAMVTDFVNEYPHSHVLAMLHGNPSLWQFVEINEVYGDHRSWQPWDEAMQDNMRRDEYIYLQQLALGEAWAADMEAQLQDLPSHSSHEHEPMDWQYIMATRRVWIRKGSNRSRRNMGRKIKTLRSHRLSV